MKLCFNLVILIGHLKKLRNHEGRGYLKKEARVNRHHNLCNPFPWMGNPFSLITHSFLRFIKLALFGLLFAIRENEVNPRERIAL